MTPKDASLKAYRRIFAPEQPIPHPPPTDPLVMRVVKDTVQGLLSPDTALLVETGGCARPPLRYTSSCHASTAHRLLRARLR